MSRVIAWFADNSVAANLLMFLIIVSGLLALPLIPQESFPEVSPDYVSVSVVLPGASPEEIESGICVPIEEAIRGLEGIRQITSSAREALGTVNIELESRADIRKVLDELKTRVDAIDDFPADSEAPVIQELAYREKIVTLSLAGSLDALDLRRLAERVRSELEELPEVGLVELASVMDYEITIELTEESLQRHDLSFDQVAAAVERSSLDLSAGWLRSESGEIRLRADAEAARGADFERIVLLARLDGTLLHLGDVARIWDGFAEGAKAARWNERPAILLEVYKQGDKNVIRTAEAVRDYLERAGADLPEAVQLSIWRDESHWLRNRLEVMYKNAALGLVLILVILMVFLRVNIALWVSAGIAVSFIGAFAAMWFAGITINMMSLFAFLVVLGLVVDDSIVIGESAHRHQTLASGDEGAAAVVRGTTEVASPVLFGVLTTIACVVPIFFLPSMIGKMALAIPFIVTAVLALSLAEAFFILPTHLASHSRGGAGPATGLLARIQAASTRGLELFVDRVLLPVLNSGLRWRYLVLAAAVSACLLTRGSVAGNWIAFDFLPPIEHSYVTALLTMPQGTAGATTSRAAHRLEASALLLDQELRRASGADEPVVRGVLAILGEQPEQTELKQFSPTEWGQFRGAHLAQVQLRLAAPEERSVTSTEIADRWRELAGPIPGAIELSFAVSALPTGDALSIELVGADGDAVRRASELLQAELLRYPGVRDITSVFRGGYETLRLGLKPEGEALGISHAELARQVRQGFHGHEVQRIRRGRHEVAVVLRYPALDRRSLHDLEAMRIRTPQGAKVPFSAVAVAVSTPGFASIDRVDRKRTVTVMADVDREYTTPDRLVRELDRTLLPELMSQHPGVSYSFAGQQRDQQETLGFLVRALLLVSVLMYVLMAVPLRSYTQPILIVMAIPVGLVGAIWGHALLGMSLSILSFVGMLALAGVVVNDALLLLDATNRGRARGLSVHHALSEASATRFSPIVMTTAATTAALLPLLFDTSAEAQWLRPMAVSLVFGEFISTVVILVLIPATYLILDDLARLGGSRPSETVPRSSFDHPTDHSRGHTDATGVA